MFEYESRVRYLYCWGGIYEPERLQLFSLVPDINMESNTPLFT